MKLVSDFDGVWTFPAAEAEAQGEILDRELEATLPDAARPKAGEWIRAARAAVAAAPWEWGWAPDGRLSAFGDEDPFSAHSALIHYVRGAAGDPIAAAMREGVAASGRTLDQLGAESHAAGVARVVSARGPAMVAEAGEAGRSMLAAGIEVVVVSNSPGEKLSAWFAHVGIPGVSHPERVPGALRFRGGARKFELDPSSSHPLQIGGHRIETARPAYERILREERPDAVVGDVFSLDLALPLRLKREEPGWSALRVLWLIQRYTPRWLRDEVAAHAGGEIEFIEGGITAVAATLTAGR